jgi:hypothetical protein
VDPATTSQVVAVGATLCGVVLTLFTNAYLERRRARDAQRLEGLRMTAEHTKWLRDERTRAYATFSLTGEEVMQFFRAELPRLLDGVRDEQHPAARWEGLRIEFRKAYNQVQLLGAEEARTAAAEVWWAGRDSADDIIRDLAAAPDLTVARSEFAERLAAASRRFGELSNRSWTPAVRTCRPAYSSAPVVGLLDETSAARRSPIAYVLPGEGWSRVARSNATDASIRRDASCSPRWSSSNATDRTAAVGSATP